MNVEQLLWNELGAITDKVASDTARRAGLVLAFGSSPLLEASSLHASIRERYPVARIVSASTAGEILGTQVMDGCVVTTAVTFDETSIQVEEVSVRELACSTAAGKTLGERLAARPGLRHVFVVSEGIAINGSDLARGLRESLPADVAVTGGLSGDGANFKRTVVGLDAPPRPGNVVAIGFHGPALKVAYGSLGGWDPFGPERIVTRSIGNVVYELDGQPALALYKKYLGVHAAGLPATGLLFPLMVRQGSEPPLVRTILGIGEESGSVTFAGDVPQGAYARLMKANFDRLVDGAVGAARGCLKNGDRPELALLVSCVGRKLLLQQRIEEEVEAVRDVLGEGPALAGFYSYGEICPPLASVKCELHNQTMTITTFSE